MQLARLCVLMCSILPGLKILQDLAGEILQFPMPVISTREIAQAFNLVREHSAFESLNASCCIFRIK
jgi:hypothetical protein